MPFDDADVNSYKACADEVSRFRLCSSPGFSITLPNPIRLSLSFTLFFFFVSTSSMSVFFSPPPDKVDLINISPSATLLFSPVISFFHVCFIFYQLPPASIAL